MLYGNINEALGLHLNHEVFNRIFQFLAKVTPELPDGRHELGDGIYAAIKHYQPGEAATKRHESHIKYADIQCVFEGGEIVYVTPRADLPITEDRLEKSDVCFHPDPPAGAVVHEFRLLPGSFLYLPPEDAHKPECLCGFAEGRKTVVKIPMSLLLPSS